MPKGDSAVRGPTMTSPSKLASRAPPARSASRYRRPNARPRKQQQATFPAVPSLGHMAPHSPAVSRPAAAAPPWLSSASMRGTPAAQRMPSTHYAARNFSDAARVPRPPKAETWMTRQTHVRALQSSPAALAAAPTATEAPAYYVVGGAVVNPQLMVSPAVQEEIREVRSLSVVPDALLRPGIGPQLNDTHGAAAAAASAGGETQRKSGSPDRTRAYGGGTWGAASGGTSRRLRGRAAPPTCAASSSVERDTGDVVVTVEAIRTGRPRAENVPLLQQTLENTATASSLGLLRRLYGTTGEDVIEVARTNPRSGALEPPRLQYHLAQELLPELTGAEAQLKTLASARRRIDWDVSIPTADTLPPPAIAFTTASNGAPVATLNSVRFRVDTSTLVMQRDYATDAATAVGGGTPVAGAAVASVGGRPRTAKSALMHEEENVGLDITREDRIGSSGLYCIHHLVGLRPGLGEQVGLERVLEYKVVASVRNLFIAPPYINSSTGDLFMELNTSLQGTAKLAITGVDCGSVDPDAGVVLKSSNTLTCYLVLQHSTSTAATKAERDQTVASTLGGGSTHYAHVPSAAARFARAITAGTAASAATMAQRSARDSSGAEAQGTDGFSLSLAHFNQEAAGSIPAAVSGTSPSGLSRTPSPAKDGVAAGAPNPVAQQGKQAPLGQPRRNSLDVQSMAARNAAEAVAVAISAAYAPAAAGEAAHDLRGGSGTVGKKADSRHSAHHYLFPATNPHELRYACYTEATRLRRLQQRKMQQAGKAEQGAAAEERCHQQPRCASATSSSGSPPQARTTLSNDEGDKDLSATLAADSGSRSQLTTSSVSKERMRRKSKVEVLELEPQVDTNGPVSAPAMTLWEPQWSKSASNSGGQASLAHRHGDGSEATPGKSGGVRDADAAANRELRGPPLPTTFFFMDSLQSPLDYMRLTGWQDRLITLFREEDKDLLRSEPRTRFKREALQELSNGALAGMIANLYLWNGGIGNSSVSGSGRRASLHARRGSSTAASRNLSGGADSIFYHSSTNINNPFAILANRGSVTVNGCSTGGGVQLKASVEVTTERTFAMLRRLILCLAVEEERASTQLYNDTVQLCNQFCHSALLKTTSLTRGTREGLQQAAAAILSAGSPASPRRMCTSGGGFDGNAGLSGKDIEVLRSLEDALELSMTTMLIVGAYGEAVEYALQRVHTLCLLEGDTDALVNAAQRDLAEAYFFYGDYVAAATIAEDVVMLTRQLCDDVPDAYEVIEAELLCTVACVAAGKRDRLPHYIDNLELNILPVDYGSDNVARAAQPLQQAQLRLVLVFAKTYLMRSGPVGATAGALAATGAATTVNDDMQQKRSAAGSALPVSTGDMATLLQEAVQLLRGRGDLQEIEQSFFTVFPSQVRPSITGDGGDIGTSTMLRICGRGRSAFTTGRASAKPVRVFGNPSALSGGEGEDAEDVAAKMEAAQKRLRWNLLCFAGAQLLQNDHEQEGMEVIESAVKELVLGKHRHVERNQRATLAAALWVGLMLAKSRMQPGQVTDIMPILKEMADRVVRTRGPLHPLAARANLLYAYVAHYVTNSRHSASLATRSLAALERGVGPQSYDRLMAHYVVGLMAEAQQRWQPAIEHLSAAYAIAQTNRLAEEDLILMDTQFLGAVLLCPPTAVLDLDTATLCARFEERLQRLRERVGPHSEKLVMPLWNTAELFYLRKNTDSAIECLQQTTRLLDHRGVLLVSTDVLKPKDVLMLEQQEAMGGSAGNEGWGGRAIRSCAAQAAEARERGEHLVAQRNALVQTSFDTVSQALHLATTLFMWAAMLESQGCTTEAREKYGQSLALYEASHLGDNSLAAVRIMEALSKLLYTVGECGDALIWARKAVDLLHIHYPKEWSLEHAAARKLVEATEHRLLVVEGTYVVQSGLPIHSEFVELL
ncbi:hypothetical protein LMJF_25_1680 [Leishmania major strain Friedlin]|uniref:Uncharacterized protein n=1 Tax=Leishmania major TaxID=5664 RepID=Q4Q9S2_LEIMA|nr:hypothetical protein LMJF_25_1680 [Leishmania major strain Friedlin]CAG9575188.1 hypothetical_protein_-_conserved [Leishmania major strain Friedlin]CAJ05384.1 hypothetical protein LMJF_25_1680 [Leishmania major strain Friedlin]|eukprot:XP_001683926.1 hypothetical protein LMJF_25_1680 [Leishmania major strain Friedlin]